MSDGVTGWCERGEHSSCHGTLRAGTGYHWWCACRCHPEPTSADAHAAPDDVRAAIAQFHRDRTALDGIDG